MNCDQVFSVLTRGPFPSGDASDHAVESHLAVCHECRHFAAALRPDNSMDAEALAPQESTGLPYYWGLAAIPSGEASVSCALPEGRRRARHRKKPSIFKRKEPLAQLSGWQLAFAVLMGAMLGTLLRILGYSSEAAPETPVALAAPPAIHAPDHRTLAPANVDDQLLAKLGATPECLNRRVATVGSQQSPYGERSTLLAESTVTQCCTECHNAQSPRLALKRTTTKIVRSCQICHTEVVDHTLSAQ